MEFLFDAGVSGDPAVDTASVPFRIEPGSVHPGPHEPLRPTLDLSQVQIDHRSDDGLPNVSDRDTAEAARTEPAANQADHQRIDRHLPTEFPLFQTDQPQRPTHLQPVARHRGRGVSC